MIGKASFGCCQRSTGQISGSSSSYLYDVGVQASSWVVLPSDKCHKEILVGEHTWEKEDIMGGMGFNG
jgi:hypothetical protein